LPTVVHVDGSFEQSSLERLLAKQSKYTRRLLDLLCENFPFLVWRSVFGDCLLTTHHHSSKWTLADDLRCAYFLN
jgi:hypothetical protein